MRRATTEHENRRIRDARCGDAVRTETYRFTSDSSHSRSSRRLQITRNHGIALINMRSASGDMTRRRRSSPQLELKFPQRGGARRNAGRKPGQRRNTPHRARPAHRSHEPVHVTLRARLAPLRSQFVYPTVRLALLGAARRDPARFRIVHYSVQRDHLHLIVEAADARALSSGIRSVAVRVARYVNDLLARRGKLWADRWHGRALKTPREMRNAILYVLANFRKHASRRTPAGVDPYSSARWFDGFHEWSPATGMPPPWADERDWDRDGDDPAWSALLKPRTWLATTGWRRYARLGLNEHPALDQ